MCTAILDEMGRGEWGAGAASNWSSSASWPRGHILIEDLPGLGKTLIARSFATALGLDFARIQFTPDLLPPTC